MYSTSTKTGAMIIRHPPGPPSTPCTRHRTCPPRPRPGPSPCRVCRTQAIVRVLARKERDGPPPRRGAVHAPPAEQGRGAAAAEVRVCQQTSSVFGRGGDRDVPYRVGERDRVRLGNPRASSCSTIVFRILCASADRMVAMASKSAVVAGRSYGRSDWFSSGILTWPGYDMRFEAMHWNLAVGHRDLKAPYQVFLSPSRCRE
ncbi:hypothetical protein K438DRAFT_114336 [Mycena galopus ATCC 62051]|nr:hypothetical protein K438DRAFT_114336 [Mycena galopus ATCC 62051]